MVEEVGPSKDARPIDLSLRSITNRIVNHFIIARDWERLRSIETTISGSRHYMLHSIWETVIAALFVALLL